MRARGDRSPARVPEERAHPWPRRRLGGGSGTDNVRHLCAAHAHNRLEAGRVYGRDYVARAIALRRERKNSTEEVGPTDQFTLEFELSRSSP